MNREHTIALTAGVDDTTYAAGLDPIGRMIVELSFSIATAERAVADDLKNIAAAATTILNRLECAQRNNDPTDSLGLSSLGERPSRYIDDMATLMQMWKTMAALTAARKTAQAAATQAQAALQAAKVEAAA